MTPDRRCACGQPISYKGRGRPPKRCTACRAPARGPWERRCQTCGTVYAACRSDGASCSVECRVALNRERSLRRFRSSTAEASAGIVGGRNLGEGQGLPPATGVRVGDEPPHPAAGRVEP